MHLRSDNRAPLEISAAKYVAVYHFIISLKTLMINYNVHGHCYTLSSHHIMNVYHVGGATAYSWQKCNFKNIKAQFLVLHVTGVSGIMEGYYTHSSAFKRLRNDVNEAHKATMIRPSCINGSPHNKCNSMDCLFVPRCTLPTQTSCPF